MLLSEQDIQIITDQPLADFNLAALRFRLLQYSDYHEPQLEDVAFLLGALMTSSAAFSLASPHVNGGNVAVTLFAISQHMRNDLIDLGQFSQLLQRIVVGPSDVDIWEEVYVIIGNFHPAPPWSHFENAL